MIPRTSTNTRVALCCCLLAIATFIVAPELPTGGDHQAVAQGKRNGKKGGIPAALAKIRALKAEVRKLNEENEELSRLLDSCVDELDVAEGRLAALEDLAAGGLPSVSGVDPTPWIELGVQVASFRPVGSIFVTSSIVQARVGPVVEMVFQDGTTGALTTIVVAP